MNSFIELSDSLNNRPNFLKKFVHQQDEIVHFNDTTDKSHIVSQQTINKTSAYGESLIKLPKTNIIKPLSYSDNNKDGLTILIIVLFIIFAYLRKVFSKKMSLITNSFIHFKHTAQLQREGNIYNDRDFYILMCLSFLIFSTLVFVLFDFYKYTLFQQLLWLYKILAVVLFLYFFKLLIVRFLTNVFKLERLYTEYTLSYHVFFATYNLIFLFLSLIFLYNSNYFIYLSIIIVTIIFFILFLFRLFIILKSLGFFSPLYFFLYICILEILPLLVLYKMLKNL